MAEATLSPSTTNKLQFQNKDYSIRYASNWSQISYDCKRLAKFKCRLCSARATETHHALYFDKAGAIAGREIPFVHIFPLCDRHHEEAHKPENWIKHHTNPILKNRNTSGFYQKLLNTKRN